MTATRSDPALQAAVDAVLPDALELSHRVHAAPEIAFEEHQASRWTAELLAQHGFEITAPAGGLAPRRTSSRISPPAAGISGRRLTMISSR